MLFLLPLPLLAFPAPARQSDPLLGGRIEYVVSLGESEVGREMVELTNDGWSAEGHYDFMGIRRGRYHATLKHGEGRRVEYEFTTDEGGKEKGLLGVFASENWTVTTIETGKDRSIGVGSKPSFVYDDLLWACEIELGRLLVRLDDANELLAAGKVTALSGLGATSFPVEIVDMTHSNQMVRGESMALRDLRVKLAGAVEVLLVTTPEGVPIRIEIPAQFVSVQAVGYESVHGPITEPRSIVDSGSWRAKLSPPSSEVQVERGVDIPMRDGVKLVADVFRPKGEGPFPTILARTPYNRLSEGTLKGGWYAKRGYVFVAQDVRGRFASGGEWFPFVNETKDGSDTLDWIARQPWSTGKIGMLGASYVGLVQWLAAKSGNPHLTCIVPQVSPPDPNQNFPYEGGAFLLGAGWWARVLESMDAGTNWAEGLDWKASFSTLPLGDFDRALKLEKQTFLDVWLAHPPEDVAFWEPSSYQGSFGGMSVPAFHVTGWWDGDQPGALQNFPGMRAGAKTELARSGQFLVIGPWTHFFNSSRAIGRVDYGDEAVIDLDARILRFFDRYLKGVENGIEHEAPVHVFTMGTNRWHAEKDWPVPETRFTKLYLSSGGNAKRVEGDGRLGLSAGAGGATQDSYRYDPLDLPVVNADFTDISGAEATRDQSTQPDRDDDLEFLSPPLSAPCEILGPIEVVLWASSDAKDTDFAASIFRVTEKGEHFAICGGVQRLRYAADSRKDAPVPPGTVAKVTIDCWATGLRLVKGERILLKLSSWAWPGYGRNLNTLEPQATAKDGVVATNTILHDANRRSHLILPVVPRSDSLGLEFAD
jgi:putative CocE/NonD family hydrolase